MINDVFNYQREKSGEHLISSDYSVVTIGDAKALFRDTSIQYQQKVRLEPELGSHEMYFITGQSEGACQATRSIGQGGLMQGISPGGSGSLDKGSIATLQMDFSAGSGAGSLGTPGISFSQVVHAQGIVLEGVTFAASSRQLEVAESLNLRIATITLEK